MTADARLRRPMLATALQPAGRETPNRGSRSAAGGRNRPGRRRSAPGRAHGLSAATGVSQCTPRQQQVPTPIPSARRPPRREPRLRRRGRACSTSTSRSRRGRSSASSGRPAPARRRRSASSPARSSRPRARSGSWARTRGGSGGHARADRLHAPAVHPVPGPDRGRERRLRGQPVRDAHAAPPAAGPGGPRARPAVGCARPAGRPAVRRHAAPARARLRPGPRAEPAPPRRADCGHRPDPAHAPSGTSSAASRPTAGRSS